MPKTKKFIPEGCEKMFAPTYNNYAGRNQEFQRDPVPFPLAIGLFKEQIPINFNFLRNSMLGTKKAGSLVPARGDMFS